MRGKVDAGGAIACDQILELVQRRGAAEKALQYFIPQAISFVCNDSAKSMASSALCLLNAAVERRQQSWIDGLTVERGAKRQRTSNSDQKNAVLAAKMTQIIVKVYAPTKVATLKAEEMSDLVAAMDLACVALYVVCALEHTARFGDLVVDNLLYQVAKKYAEIPKMRKSASCVAACVHVRLWNEHAKLCNESCENDAPLMAYLQDDVAPDIATKVAKKAELLAEFPRPKSFHSAQFARLLLGHTNTCITLLVVAQNYEAVRLVAASTLSPWIDHLQKLSDQNLKLISSLNDRTFRILWKCGADESSDGQDSSKAASSALLSRSLALAFLLKCSTYSSKYYIQQVYRVGVQHERVSRRSRQGFEEICAFYDRSADALLQPLFNSEQMYESESLQWEYIQWLEHFACICEALEMHLKSAIILEYAVHYTRLFGSMGKPIESCLLFSIAGVLFSASGSKTCEKSSTSCDGFGSNVCAKWPETGVSKVIRDLTQSTAPDQLVVQFEEAARVYLKKFDVSIASSLGTIELQTFPVFVQFMTRCLKRSSTKAFNYTISVQHSAKYQLCRQVVASFAAMCEATKKLRASADLDRKTIEMLVLEEARLHRMAVVLLARCRGDTSNSTPTKSALHAVSHHVDSFRELLDTEPSESILQGILGDLKSIARECYSCATQCYKAGSFHDTISALTGAFELAEGYLKGLMCSDASVDEIHKAHAQLKVDDIASLLAHCFREGRDATRSRLFTGYSLVYCGDIHQKIPHASVDKYVSCVLDELRSLDNGLDCSIMNTFKSLLDNISGVFQARRISENQIMMLWSTFRYAFECSSAKVMSSLRVEDCNDVASISSERCVELCGTLQSYLDSKLMSVKLKTIDGDLSDAILLDVSQSLARRKLIYCSYYVTRDFAAAIDGLLLLHDSLSRAIGHLQSLAGVVSVDLGGVYGWRGVLTMEIALIASYAGFSEGGYVRGNVCINEGSAIADIVQCLKYWDGGNVSGVLFDGPYVVCCLNSICNTLSLMSCLSLEVAARRLLKMLYCSVNVQGVIASPVLALFDSHFESNRSVMETQVVDSQTTDIYNGMQLFEQVDKELFAAEKSHFGGDRGQTCQHLLNAITVLGNVKPTMRQCQSASIAKAVGMRELFVHTILSDFHFHEGRSEDAIAEAKTALRLCWKMARKCAAFSSSADTSCFKLPSELSTPECQQRTSAHVLYFMALESSSWDVLYAAKLMLCRIASLCSLSDQPHRASAYLMEAMRLVGGLDLRFFRRHPFYEYAELELNASHLEQAKVAISLLSFGRKVDSSLMVADNAVGAMTSKHHAESDLASLLQKCNEIVQRGDVHDSEGDQQRALACFTKAIEALDDIEKRGLTLSKRFGRTKARCWRKCTRLQSQISDFTDVAAVERLLTSMKKLKQSIKSCGVHLERVKCLLELGRINTRLLRSTSRRAFTSLDRTLALLEEAYVLGEHLGVPHLCKEVRTALAMTYFAEIEEYCCSKAHVMDEHRVKLLSWMSSVLLSNAASTGMAVKEVASMETNSDVSARDALVMQLQRLAADSSANHEVLTHTHLTQMTERIAEQVQQLPDNWVVVSVMMDLSSSELVISRLSTNGTTPVSFCLPMATLIKPIREMDMIIQDSRKGLAGYTAEEASSWSTEEKKKWWNGRKLLDARIEKALSSMQKALGFWRCLFAGGSGSLETERIRRCWEVLLSNKSGRIRLLERNQTLLCAIANAQHCLSDSEVLDGLKHIAAEMGEPTSDAIVREALHVLRTKQNDSSSSASTATSSNLTQLSKEEIARKKVAEVKQLLAAEGLRTDGLKKVLVERLLAARDTALAKELGSAVESIDDGIDIQSSIILILHHELQQFPWEGMDVMAHCSGVTRMPSIDLIVENARRPLSIRRERVRFLLNPAGDLKSTEHQLKPLLECGAKRYNWEGVVGQVPDPNELRNYLASADLFLYCGHGSGEVYLHRDKVLGLRPNCSAAFLFGCSSGRLEHEGIFGPSGAVLSYLHAGSPAVLAMLWDVTDRDIDQLSVKILQEWLLTNNDDMRDKLSLAQALQESRSVCKLKYLNGHAAICYGLPLYVATS